MHQGCVAGANEGGRERPGWWPTSPSCRWAGRRTTPVSWPPTTNSTYPATARVRAGGTAPAPPRWGCRAKHRWPGSRPCSRAATPLPGSCWGAPMAATPCPPSTWCCGRPRASPSSTAGLGDRPGRAPSASCWAGRGGRLPGRAPGRPSRPRWCPERVRTGRAGGRLDHRTSREGDPLPHTHLVIANRVQGPDGRWTVVDGRDLYRHRLAADAIYRATYQRTLSRTLRVEWTAADSHGNRELQGMPEALARSFSKRTGQIDQA